MKYKLYTDEIYSSPREQILRARGIENIDEWVNASKEVISNWKKLDYEEISLGVHTVYLAYKHNLKVALIVD